MKDPTPLDEVGAAVTIGALLLTSPLLRPWYAAWGAPPAETRRPLPGDEIVPHPWLQVTRAITIAAPPRRIWPWLVQIGQEKGGLYSYTRLENLVGCRMRNASAIHPAWQTTVPGDVVRLAPPGGGPFFTVVTVAPESALVLRASDPVTQVPGPVSWAFFLEPLDADRTRLWARFRNGFAPNLGNVILWRLLVEPMHFVMERQMLRGLQARAEGRFQS